MISFGTAESLSTFVKERFGQAVSVRARRPRGRLYQIEIPAFLPDGDSAQIYLEPGPDAGYMVSDLSHTAMRLSYARDLSDAMLEKLSELAERHGFTLTGGKIEAQVRPDELLGALFGLAQIEAAAEDAIQRATSRGPRADEFKALVIEALRRQFHDKVEVDVMPPGEVIPGYAVDAVVNLARPVAVQAIPNDIEAERAIGTRYKAAGSLAVKSWIAVPRELKKLTGRTQERLVDAFIISGSKFEERALADRLNEIAA